MSGMSQDSLVYLGNVYPPAEFERQFNPRLAVEDPDSIQPRREQLSDETRAALPHILGVSYGDREREVIDIYPAAARDDSTGTPTLIYFHGGYFRQGHARENNYAARAFAEAGAAVFVATYDLCPDVPLGTIAAQAKAAIAWVYANAAEHGGDPNRLFIIGHSAGAHLVAMALAEGVPGVVPDMLRGAMLISGIYDLAPVRETSLQAELRISDEDQVELSPLSHPPALRVPLVISWGEAETEEWRRQSTLFAAVTRSAGTPVEEVPVPGADHFSIAFDLMDPAKPQTRVMLSMMGLG